MLNILVGGSSSAGSDFRIAYVLGPIRLIKAWTLSSSATWFTCKYKVSHSLNDRYLFVNSLNGSGCHRRLMLTLAEEVFTMLLEAFLS